MQAAGAAQAVVRDEYIFPNKQGTCETLHKCYVIASKAVNAGGDASQRQVLHLLSEDQERASLLCAASFAFKVSRQHNSGAPLHYCCLPAVHMCMETERTHAVRTVQRTCTNIAPCAMFCAGRLLSSLTKCDEMSTLLTRNFCVACKAISTFPQHFCEGTFSTPQNLKT